MKRIILLLTLAVWLGATTTLLAQPTVSYDLKSKIDTYKPISGGTVVGAGLKGTALDDLVFNGSEKGVTELTTAAGIPIGFDFIYNGQTMNRFAIGSHLFVVLGNNEVTTKANNSGFVISEEEAGKFNLFGVGGNTSLNGLDTTEISYKTIGVAPNRVLVVQYKNIGLEIDWSGVYASVNLQIRINEGLNTVEFVFKNWTTTGSKDLIVGIKGSKAGDIHTRETSTSWENTILGLSKYSKCLWNSSCYPADGLTFTFAPPAICETPTKQAENLLLVPTSTDIKGSFTPADADHHLVVLSESETLSNLPANKTNYKIGDQLGNGTVILADTAKSFTTTLSLEKSKKYYIHIFAYNSYCSDGPLYNTQNPTKQAVTTMPEAPCNIAIKSVDYHTITLSASANQTNDPIIIAYTDVPKKNSSGQLVSGGSFGVPSGILNVGDLIVGGGEIVYKGSSNESIVVEQLVDNRIYHFKAWSIAPTGNQYSSLSIEDDTLTLAKTPFYEDFSTMALYDSPYGWEKEGQNFRTVSAGEKEGTKTKMMLECDVRAASVAAPAVNSVTTPWIKTDDAENFIIFNYNMAKMGSGFGSSWSPHNIWDEDSRIEIQVSENGIDYTSVYTITKENAPSFKDLASWTSKYISLAKYANKNIKVRVYWKLYEKGVRLRLNAFAIGEVPACAAPSGILADDVNGAIVSIKWNTPGDEKEWNIHYRVKGTTEWSENVIAKNNPFVLEGLNPLTQYEVQVQSICTQENKSDWSETSIIATGYEIPFTEDFNTCEATVPNFWTIKKGELTDDVILTDGSRFDPCLWSVGSHKDETNNKSVNIKFNYTPQDWVLSPIIDLGDGSTKNNLEFDLSLIASNTDFTAPSELPYENARFAAVISKDGGTSYHSADTLKTWKSSNGSLLSIGSKSHYVLPLHKYKGKIQIGFYFECPDSEGDLKELLLLDNVAFLPTCYSPEEVSVKEITYKQATVEWQGAASGYEVSYKEKAANKWSILPVTVEQNIILTQLTAETDYTVRVRSICAISDTSAWSRSIDFRTDKAPVCNAPTNLTSGTITSSSAVLSWDADVENIEWNLRYRDGNTTSWITVNELKETNYTLENLTPATAYLWSVQSVCEELVSRWAIQKEFTTEVSGIESTGNSFKVFGNNGAIHIMNEANFLIDHIEVYDLSGKLIHHYLINGSENVLITTQSASTVIVKIFSNHTINSYKIIL